MSSARTARRRRGPAVRAMLAGSVAVLVLGAVWLALCLRFVAHPNLDDPGTADAVVVLGGDEEVGWQAGRDLVDDGVADELVVSVPYGRPEECSTPPPGVAV